MERPEKTSRAATLLLTSIFLALICTPALAGKKLAPLKVPSDEALGFSDNSRADVLSTVKKVGILPIELPEEFNDRADTKVLIESLVTKYLQQANFEVAESAKYSLIWDRLNKEIGGIYDRRSGEQISDKTAALRAASKREFISQENLTGLVRTRVFRTEANFQGAYATWDGVTEGVSGLTGVANFASTFSPFSYYQGSLGALSLWVQLQNSEGRVIFGRFGGIQLATYTRNSSEFYGVKSSDLLRDTYRLDRAAYVATLPLVLPPETMALDKHKYSVSRLEKTKPPLPPEGQLLGLATTPSSKRAELLSKTRRLAIGEVDSSSFQISPALVKKVSSLVKAELTRGGFEVADRAVPEQLIREAFSSDSLYDPYTGIRDEVAFLKMRERFFSTLDQSSPGDAILWLSLVPRTVKHTYGDVFWDGTNQNAVKLTPVNKGPNTLFPNTSTGSGTLRAISFSARLMDKQGIYLFSGLGGLQLAQYLVKRKTTLLNSEMTPTDFAPSELFNDDERLIQAVHLALRELVLTPEELEREIPQKKDPKKSK